MSRPYREAFVEISDDLITLAMCEISKADVQTKELWDWCNRRLLPVTECISGLDLSISSIHVHNGTEGLTPHDHLPHDHTSIVYLLGDTGNLVLHVEGEDCEVTPCPGLLLTFPASVVHHVKPSTGLRLSLVVNYVLDEQPGFQSDTGNSSGL